MEKTSVLVNNIFTNTSHYIQLQTRSLKLELYERVTNIISTGIGAAFIGLFVIFSFLFLNIGLAFWVSELFKSFKLGFLTVGLFYFVVLGVYLLLRNRVAKNKVKNAVLLKVSKTLNDYDQMLKDQEVLHNEVEQSEKVLKENMEELKNNIKTLQDDFKKLKGNFVSHTDEETNTTVGPKIPRIAITSILDLVLQKVVFRNTGLVAKTVLPIIANAFITSKVFKENKKTSLIQNLKLKFSKFLS
jgi:hypothetical protein